MKKVVASIAVVGMVASASAADLGVKDAEFLFGQENVNVVTMSGAEMAQTEGQLLSILGILGSLPVVGELLGGVLGTVNLDALVVALPQVLASAFPIELDLNLAVGGLLNITTGNDPLTIDSGLPALLGAAVAAL